MSVFFLFLYLCLFVLPWCPFALTPFEFIYLFRLLSSIPFNLCSLLPFCTVLWTLYALVFILCLLYVSISNCLTMPFFILCFFLWPLNPFVFVPDGIFFFFFSSCLFFHLVYIYFFPLLMEWLLCFTGYIIIMTSLKCGELSFKWSTLLVQIVYLLAERWLNL